MIIFIISLLVYLDSDCDFIFKFIIPIILSVIIYLFYWIGLWVVCGFLDKKEFNNKGLIIVLTLSLIFFVSCTIFLTSLNYKQKREYRKIEKEYATYRSRNEGNFTGWTLEEIKDLFNDKPN